jgi:hypothetical protein
VIRCAPCHADQDRALTTWRGATDWKQLLRLNREYLLSHRDETSDNAGLLVDIVTPDSGPRHLRLYAYGVFPLVSSGGGEAKRSVIGSFFRPVSIEISERPFFEFLVPTLHPLLPLAKVNAFIKAILNNKNIQAVVYSERAQYPKPNELAAFNIPFDPLNVPPKGIQSELHWFRSTAKGKVVRSAYRQTMAPETLANAEWFPYHYHDLSNVHDMPRKEDTLGRMDRNAYRSVPAIAAMQPLNISMWPIGWHEHSNWNLDYLQRLVEGLCVKVGMQPVFMGRRKREDEDDTVGRGKKRTRTQ